VLRNEETLRDLVRPEVLVEEQQHLDLARRESLGDVVGNARAAAVAAANAVEQPARDRTRKRGVALRGSAQELGDPLGRLTLQQVAGRAALDRGKEVVLGARGGEDDDFAVGGGGAQ